MATCRRCAVDVSTGRPGRPPTLCPSCRAEEAARRERAVRTCEQCGEPFEAKAPNHRFCSTSCQARSRYLHRPGYADAQRSRLHDWWSRSGAAARQDRAEMLFAWAENGCTVCGLRIRGAIWAYHVEPGKRPAARVRGDALLRELAKCRPLCPTHAALVRREQALAEGDVSFDDLVEIVRRKYPETLSARRRSPWSHLAIRPARRRATLEPWDLASECRSPSVARGAKPSAPPCLRLRVKRRR